jgi:3-oxoacyl-[acyl-carrier protein] reductase
MDLGLKGKVAVVTGGSQGIGSAAALRFAKEGANVAICARNADRLEQASAGAAQDRRRGTLHVRRLQQAEDIEKFMGAVVKKFGRIDVLVNNAGRVDARKVSREPTTRSGAPTSS